MLFPQEMNKRNTPKIWHGSTPLPVFSSAVETINSQLLEFEQYELVLLTIMPTLLHDQKNLLTDLINRYRNHVDFLTIRLEEAEGTNIVLRRDKVETLSEGISLGGQVRACHKGGWGFAAFNDLSTLAEQIEEAITAAKIVGEEETILAPIKIIQTVCDLPTKTPSLIS